MITEEGCVIVLPGAGASVRSLSEAPTLIKATGEETQDLVAVFEQTTPGHSGPPVHIHDHCAEMFYVLEGEFVFKAGTQLFKAPQGTFAFVPKGIAHTYVNAGTTPARLLYSFTPAAEMVHYFAELSKLPPGPADRAELDRIAERHGVQIVDEPIKPSA